MSALTRKQHAILSFIEKELRSGHPCPSHRELADHFDFASKSAVVKHIRALIKKGVLMAESGKARSLQLVNHTRAVSQTVVKIPFFGSIPAGHGQDREPESGEAITVTIESIGFKPTKSSFALRVTGDSMIGRHICDGDIAVFEHRAEPRSGQIVAALIDGKNTLKSFIVKNGKAFLRAENPKYPDLIPSDELVIQGVLKTLIRKARE